MQLKPRLAGVLIVLTAQATQTVTRARHAVDPSVFADSVAQHVAQQDADRAAIHQALASPQVRQTAASAGIDLDHFDTSVDTLTGPSLDRAAATARQVNEQLVGGAST